MALGVGTRFGAYEIIGTLGAGGMGEVYRASDTNLKRQVAIKILPPAFASDADRIARFQREAEALAALNHSNIAQIYGLERSGETTALAMELVEGSTLADRIAEGPIPTDEALTIAMQIADALEAAHEQNIVHRDLKPANVKIKSDGTVKVLDFGIATAPESAVVTSGQRSPTLLTPALTEAGVLLGTAAYMSPEQARGRPVDRRADTWAFGCVLYEMLTGQPAFGGEDVTTTLARVLEREANTAALPAALPSAVRHTIAMCLEKDVKKRIADIRDVKLSLAGAFESGSSETASHETSARPLWRRAVPIALGLVMGVVIAGLGAFGFWPAPKAPRPQSLNRFDWQLPNDQTFSWPLTSVMTLSPDGRYIVYAASDGLYIRSMSELVARRIPGTEKEGARKPFFSPDSRSIAYWTFGGQLKRIAIGGGAPVVIADGVSGLSGASWSPDDTILYGQAQGIFRVPATGGKPKLVIPAKAGEQVYGPRLLPDGDSVLFSVTKDRANWDKAQVVVQSLSTGKRTVVIKAGSDARYVSPGYLVYALGGQLYAVAFDLGTLTVSGAAVPVAQGVMRARFGSTGTANYGVSANGTLVYVNSKTTGLAAASDRLVWVDHEGHEEPLGLEPCLCINPAVSPDGTRVAFQRVALNGTTAHIWVWSIARHSLMRLTFATGLQGGPLWTADSKRIAYRSDYDIFVRDADGTGTPKQLVPHATPWAWTPDGELIFSDGGAPGHRFGVLAPNGDRKPKFILPTTTNEWSAALSPDGHWLAYQSDETGRYEIYVRPYPNVDGGKWQISTDGGQEPEWDRDGHTLFFLGPKSLMATTVETTSSFSFRTPKAVLDRSDYAFVGGPPRTYGISPDGKRFLLVKWVVAPNSSAAERPRIIIVQNWLEGLKRKVPTD